MNKKKFKVVGLTLGLSMAVVGMAAAVGASSFSHDSPIMARAVEQPYYTLTCVKNTSNTGYDKTFDVKITDSEMEKTWNVPGNQNFDGWWRIGGKGGKNKTDVQTFNRVITGKTDFDDAISSIRVNHNGVNNTGAVVNSVTLTVASDAAFTSVIDTVNMTPTVSKNEADYFTFQPSAPLTEWAADSFYKINFNITCTGSSNYGIDLTSIVFYQDIVSHDKATDISASPNMLAVSNGGLILDSLSTLTVSAKVNDVLTEYNNYRVSVTRRDGSVEDVLAATAYHTGDKLLTLTANDPTTVGGSEYCSCDVALAVNFDTPVTVGSKYAIVAHDSANENEAVFTCSVSSGHLGEYAVYTTTPAAYGVLVEEGLYDGTFALKILSGDNADKYVAWNGNNAQLDISDEKNLLSSWVIANDGEDDIIACASAEASRLRFNENSGKNARFCVYNSATGVNPDFLPLGTAKTDTFAADYMKMATYDPDLDGKGGTGACFGPEGYYVAAKAFFNEELVAGERALICDPNGLYADAYARLLKWAEINGDEINDSFEIVKAAWNVRLNNGTQNYSAIIIAATLLAGAAAIGGLVLLRKRKHN